MRIYFCHEVLRNYHITAIILSRENPLVFIEITAADLLPACSNYCKTKAMDGQCQEVSWTS